MFCTFIVIISLVDSLIQLMMCVKVRTQFCTNVALLTYNSIVKVLAERRYQTNDFSLFSVCLFSVYFLFWSACCSACFCVFLTKVF